MDMDQQIYNCRHSRAMQTIENTFGIMAARWRILGRPIEFMPDKAVDVVKACLVLHNYLTHTDESCYIPQCFADSDSAESMQPGEWRSVVANDSNLVKSVTPMQRSRSGSTSDAAAVRSDLMAFFQSPQGSVSWQHDSALWDTWPLIKQ